MASEVFDESNLGTAIAETWGNYGAHMGVYRELLKRATHSGWFTLLGGRL